MIDMRTGPIACQRVCTLCLGPKRTRNAACNASNPAALVVPSRHAAWDVHISVRLQLWAVRPAVCTHGMLVDFCQVFEAWQAAAMHASCLFCASYRSQVTGRHMPR
jgi:hypothetical protein